MRLEILAALINGAVLFAIAIGIGVEAWHRLRVPQLVNGPLLLGVAAVGFVANLAAVVVLHRGHEHSLKPTGRVPARGGRSPRFPWARAHRGRPRAHRSGWVMADPLISL